MTRPFLTRFVLVALLSLVLRASPGYAQFGSFEPSGVNAAFIKLFGGHTNFSATVDALVLDKSGKPWVRVPLDLAALDQKVVMDVDLAKAVSGELPAFALNSLKESGMSRVVSIVRPDQRATFLVYPGARSYVRMPLSREDAEALEKGYRVESTSLGKETLAGKERTRNKVVVRDAKGAPVLEAETWTAPESDNFPVQIETRQDKMTIILRFSGLKFTKPDPAQFQLPPEFTEYPDVRQMMFGIMKQIVSGSAGK